MKAYIPILLTLFVLAASGAARAQETDTNSTTIEDPFKIIQGNNIFDQSRRPRASSGPIVRYGPTRRVETITFHGTILDDGAAVAFLQCSNSRDKWMFKPGDSVDGLKVAQINVDSVILTGPREEAETNTPEEAASNRVVTISTNPAAGAQTNPVVLNSTNPVAGAQSNWVATKPAVGAPTNVIDAPQTNPAATAPTIGANTTFVLNKDTHATLRREDNGPWQIAGYAAAEASAPAVAAGTVNNSDTSTPTATVSSGGSDNDVIARLRKKREEDSK